MIKALHLATTFGIVILACAILTIALFRERKATDVTVTPDHIQHGSIHIEPPLPPDGEIKRGTLLRVTATPAPGYAFDSSYYTQPEIGHKRLYEFMTPTFEVRVNHDTTLGASFIEQHALEGFTVKQDVFYAQPGVKKLKYDVFSPNGAKNLPIIVIIHGGGWISNTEDVMRGLARELARSGDYVVCSMDYRWLRTRDGDKDGNTMADLIADVFGGLAHIQEHAREYGGDGSRIAVTGDSAGGHLAAVASLMPDKIGDGGFGRKKGVWEFRPTYIPAGKTTADVRSALTMAIKAGAASYGIFSTQTMAKIFPGQPHAVLEAVSPQEHIPNVKDRAVPQYLLRGTEDRVVNDKGVRAFADALKAAGQTVEYVQVAGAGHAFFDWRPDAHTKATFAKYGATCAARMRAFFDRVFFDRVF